jgi:tRNA U34 5-carboxymethylaminomethyl modifying enzyme MnmG/GidA
MKQFHYVYLTINIINKKLYVGEHSTNNLNDKYIGSGRPLLNSAFKKYGKRNFKKEILEYFNTKEEAFNAQEKYIKQYNTLCPNGYNISPKGGLGIIECFSEETKKKMSEAHKGKKLSKEHKLKISLSSKGIKKNPHSESTKQKIINSLKQNAYIQNHKHSKETKKKMSMAHQGQIPWNKNIKGIIKLSEETKRKISESKRKRITFGEFGD